MSAEPEMKEIVLRQAKAPAADLDAAMLLNCMLSDVFEDEVYPRGLDGEFDEDAPDYFDADDEEHLRELWKRLRKVYRRCPGGMNRVIFGMSCLLMPENRLVDPDKDHLAPHPAIRWVEQEATEGTEAQPEGEGDGQ